MKPKNLALYLFTLAMTSALHAEPVNISGVYPSLTMWNVDGECGSGAVVPWQGSLYLVTYSPHKPEGSKGDKLYEVTADMEQVIFPGSVGGTPANRMIHKESNQLLIGPYVIDAEKKVRVIPPSKMHGRLTGNARHLSDPENKVYYATMEEALYEVDVNTLEVTTLIRDGDPNSPSVGVESTLPGYHGKGLYSGQGRLVYANNGEKSPEAKMIPTTTSGALAQWFGEGDWQMVRRNQFTELTGPNGIYGGGENPDSDPIWGMGWDARSLLLGLLEDGEWTFYRLPKGSHSYDGAHGWNTEWPRIREIGEKDFLATMHGTFWRFPSTFSKANSKGIAPRSNYLKVIGDFALWNGRIAFGCDDSAKSEFLNTRTFKSKHASTLESNSNIWFVEPEKLDSLGPVIGRGSVWLRDEVKVGVASDPYLFSGYDYRQLNLSHQGSEPVIFTLEVDRDGTGEWKTMTELIVPAKGGINHLFTAEQSGTWIRLKTDRAAEGVTAHFHYRNHDERVVENAGIFAGVSTAEQTPATFGLMRSLSHKELGLGAFNDKGEATGTYVLNQKLELVPADDPKRITKMAKVVLQPGKAYSVDAASVIIVEEGQRYRLPKNPDFDEAEEAAALRARVCREVATERDLLSVQGTFYELPARNAQGMAKMRAISTPNLVIHDFCSHMGLLFFTGIDADTKSDRIIRSADGKAAVWAGVIDELWSLGKPRGEGGPWMETAVEADAPSDPYLMTGYDRKSVTLTSSEAAAITIEVDVDGTGLWLPYETFNLKAGEKVSHNFPEGFSAYWVRTRSDSVATATALFKYD